MTDEAISPLRRRMIKDMTIRKLGPKTQAGCIRAAKNFATVLGHSPDRAGMKASAVISCTWRPAASASPASTPP